MEYYFIICIVLITNLITLSLGYDRIFGIRVENTVNPSKSVYLDGLISHRWHTIEAATNRNKKDVVILHGGGKYKLTFVNVIDLTPNKSGIFEKIKGGIGENFITFKFKRPTNRQPDRYEVLVYGIDNKNLASSSGVFKKSNPTN